MSRLASMKRMTIGPLRAPARVNFVLSSDFDPTSALAAASIDALVGQDEDFRLAMNGSKADLNMIALTFIYMRRAGIEGIRLSRQLEPGWINIAHSESLRLLPARSDAFAVDVQGDFPRRRWAHHHIVQNRDQLDRHSSCIYLWPQPGIVPRAPTGPAVQRVGYLGQTYNGNLAWDEDRWRQLLQPLGVEFVAKSPDRWHDFSDLDAAIAIRSFGDAPHSAKPPSKLINAWLAGVPFIGGADSAYVQAGTPGVDYLRASTPQDVVRAVAALRSDPGLAAALVDRGRERAARFDNAAILRRWIDVIEGPVARRYARWSASPRQERVRSRMLIAADRAAVELRRRARKVWPKHPAQVRRGATG